MAVKSFSVSVLSRVQSGKHQDLYPFSSLAMQVSSQLLAFGIHISQLRMLSNLQVPSAMLPEPWGQFSITLFSCSGSKSGLTYPFLCTSSMCLLPCRGMACFCFWVPSEDSSIRESLLKHCDPQSFRGGL